MADLPFPLTSNQMTELKPQILEMFRDIYENRVGGAELGDVFVVSGDTLQLQIKTGCGLKKTNGRLDFDKTVIGTTASDISNTPSGTISATNVQDAINELDSEKAIEGGYASFNHVCLKNGITAPAAEAGYVLMFMDEADSKLKVRFPDGVLKEVQYV